MYLRTHLHKFFVKIDSMVMLKESFCFLAGFIALDKFLLLPKRSIVVANPPYPPHDYFLQGN